MSLHPTKPSCVSFFLSTQQACHQKKQKDFTPSVYYRVRLDCRRKCIFLTCDYKAHVCADALSTFHDAHCMWNSHLYLKLEVNILYRKWLLGLKLARDRNLYLLTVTAHMHAKWAAFQCASINIHQSQKLKWELWTPFQSEISKQLK